jgi:uncharacterized protein YhaN
MLCEKSARRVGFNQAESDMAELLSAEKVMEREKQRFQERYERAQKEADEAKAQVEKLEQAIRILNEGSSPAKGE